MKVSTLPQRLRSWLDWSDEEAKVHMLKYAADGTFTRYSGYESIRIAPANTFSVSAFDWNAMLEDVSNAIVRVTAIPPEMLRSGS